MDLRFLRDLGQARDGREVHLRCDGKSAEAIEKERVVRETPDKRVYKILRRQKMSKKERQRTGRKGCGVRDCYRQTRQRIAGSTLSVNYFIGTVRMRCGKSDWGQRIEGEGTNLKTGPGGWSKFAAEGTVEHGLEEGV